MNYPKLNLFSSIFQCLKRSQEQRDFEQQLYLDGLQKQTNLIIQKINAMLDSKELATKFLLQELDVARQGDQLSQAFVSKSGFHPAQYLGALKKVEEEQEALEKIQGILLSFLNKISNQNLLSQTAMSILDGVMQHWLIGKYSPEGQLFVNETESTAEPREQKKLEFSAVKNLVMDKLYDADARIQTLLDRFTKSKEKPLTPKEEVSETQEKVRSYSQEDVHELMEEYSHVIEDIITGQINPDNIEAILHFQQEISMAAQEGNNLASVFCAFFTPKASFTTLPLPIIDLNDKSKTFFIQILSTFEEKGFSKSLDKYLEENRESVYALATSNDKFMQYLMAFWYAKEHEERTKIEHEQRLWYKQSAANGFEPAVQQLQAMESMG